MRLEIVSLDDAENWTAADLMMQWGQAEGAIPPDRSSLTGTEDAVFAYADTQAGGDFIVGCAVFYRPDGHDMIFLDILYVAENMRRRGIGRALIEAVFDQARKLGVAKVEFGTKIDNTSMQALGRRCGFANDAIFMSRRFAEEKRH
ncbi:MAG: GNAT family N-acetyltransferase [Mesorhizobium sp.]|uniref:GNAT family N-acetyltransferase n=1 Tax=Mesorhizobium sp. TaxID=1871066 RepID=UPI000FE46351|nr:GNAT family N-acetyltransferase [Mesorhizobium sp.]RWB85937.1 MAG: GNAT family N-acetyltransferase [Mesorhizobium sp.]